MQRIESATSVLDWAIPDIGISGAQLGAAVRLLEGPLGGPARVELAFIGGSLAVGLGHATSDVDLYVVGTGLPDAELTWIQDGVPVQVNPLDAAAVRRLAALASGFWITAADRPQLGTDVKAFSALVRLATGRRLLTSAAWESELAALSMNAVRQLLMARHASLFAVYAEDVAGALASGDLLTAVGAAGLALEAGCEAALAAAGDVYLGPKFLFRRLARTPATAPWCDRVWGLVHDGLLPHEPGTVRAVVAERLQVGGLLLSRALLDGWAEPLAGFPDPAPAGPAAVPAGPRRNLYSAPLRFADGWVLQGPVGGYRTRAGLVRLWSRLDGRPQAGLRAALAAEAADLADITGEDVDAAVGQLQERGLAECARPGTAARPARPGGPLFIADAPDAGLGTGGPAHSPVGPGGR
jgi:hypothetical protein